MKTKNILSTTILALAGIVLSTAAARADGAGYANGDLLVSFRATGAPGAATNYVIDVGSAANYIAGGIYSTGNIVNLTGNIGVGFTGNATTAAIAAGLTGLGTDLGNLYGTTTWYNRSNLLWSVLGVVKPSGSGFSTNTIFASSAEDPLTVGTAGPAQVYIGGATGSGIATNMQTMASAYKNTAGSAASTATAGEKQDTSTFINNYSSFSDGGTTSGGSTLFGIFGASNPVAENNFGSGAANSVNDLYRLNNTGGTAGDPGTLVGAFKFDTTGNLYFSSDVSDFAPVPEPASATLIAAGLLGALSLGKRRRLSRSAQA